MFLAMKIPYRAFDVDAVGYVTADNGPKRPAVIVLHDWRGLSDFAKQKADALAALGYVAFAADLYGEGQVAQTDDEAAALMAPLAQDKALLRKRLLATYDIVAALPSVDPTQIGAIGFCFGGMSALELLLTEQPLVGIAGFHASLQGFKGSSFPDGIQGKILLMQGFDDPMATPAALQALGQALTQAEINWEIDIYGNTLHAFTNPQAHDASKKYNREADTRSWNRMQLFFEELFS